MMIVTITRMCIVNGRGKRSALPFYSGWNYVPYSKETFYLHECRYGHNKIQMLLKTAGGLALFNQRYEVF